MRKLTIYHNNGSILAVHKGGEFVMTVRNGDVVKVTYDNGDEFIYVNATCVLVDTKEGGDE